MPQSAEDAVAAVEQRRIDGLLAGDVATLDQIIDDACTHVESNGVARAKAAFPDHVARREVSFDLYEIMDSQRAVGKGRKAVPTRTHRYAPSDPLRLVFFPGGTRFAHPTKPGRPTIRGPAGNRFA